jgi:hypothetical protein
MVQNALDYTAIEGGNIQWMTTMGATPLHQIAFASALNQ